MKYELTSREAINIGIRAAELFNIKLNRQGKYPTQYGDKSAEGLGRMVYNLMKV